MKLAPAWVVAVDRIVIASRIEHGTIIEVEASEMIHANVSPS
jgi:hypothetical protein